MSETTTTTSRASTTEAAEQLAGELRDRRHDRPSQPGFSQMTAPPMPKPTHIAVSP